MRAKFELEYELPQWKLVSDEGGSKLTTAILKPIIYYLVLQFSITTNPLPSLKGSDIF